MTQQSSLTQTSIPKTASLDEERANAGNLTNEPENSGKPVTSQAESKAAQPPTNQAELERVRELLLGPDLVQQRLRGAEVNRLREIVFGDQIQEYERRFTDLEREMKRVLASLRQMQDDLSDFEKTQTQRLETLERGMHQADDELRRELTKLRTHEAMLQQLHTQVRQQEMLGQSVQDQASALRKAATQQESDLRSLKAMVEENRMTHERKLDSLKREVQHGADELLTELRQVTERLNTQKTDRKALASMLIEVATRLETGGNVASLFEGLTSSTQE
jgi:chromosome segregation ATPase